MKARTLIRVSGADLGYGAEPVLRDVTCSIERGGIVGLVGPNGAGKTTFLRALLGMLAPSRGSVEVLGARRFAYVPQAEEVSPFWPLRVREAVLLPFRAGAPLGIPPGDAERFVDEAMARVGIARHARSLLSELSGGQRQKVMLAQAVAQRPEVLLLDEPTRGLDVAAEADFLSLVADLRTKEGMTILLVTHDLHIPAALADQVLLFKDGWVIATTAAELMKGAVLEETYGIPFASVDTPDLRWIGPRRKAP